MIVPMKKYSFLVYHREYLSFLEGIQDLGVLHVIEKESGEIENDELRQMYHTLNEMNAAIKFLSKRQTEKYNENSTDDTKLIVSELKKIWADEDEYRQKLTHAEKEAALAALASSKLSYAAEREENSCTVKNRTEEGFSPISEAILS